MPPVKHECSCCTKTWKSLTLKGTHLYKTLFYGLTYLVRINIISFVWFLKNLSLSKLFILIVPPYSLLVDLCFYCKLTRWLSKGHVILMQLYVSWPLIEWAGGRALQGEGTASANSLVPIVLEEQKDPWGSAQRNHGDESGEGARDKFTGTTLPAMVNRVRVYSKHLRKSLGFF